MPPSDATADVGSASPEEGPPDRVLADRIQDGDREAFGRLVRRYLRPVHAVVASYLSEPADVEDAVQDTFLRALEGIGGYDTTRPFSPWLYQVARNVARNRLDARSRHRTEPLPESGAEAEADGPEAEMNRAEIRRRVAAAADELPERQRLAFRLVDVEGYGASEAAEMMELAPGTVRSHLFHARRSLRAELAPLMDERETR